MSRKYLAALIALGLGASMVIAACGGTGPAGKAQLDSGPADLQYQGVAQPVVSSKLKLTDNELKTGIEKIPIRSRSGQQLKPEAEVKESPLPEKEGQAGDVAKPQV